MKSTSALRQLLKIAGLPACRSGVAAAIQSSFSGQGWRVIVKARAFLNKQTFSALDTDLQGVSGKFWSWMQI